MVCTALCTQCVPITRDPKVLADNKVEDYKEEKEINWKWRIPVSVVSATVVGFLSNLL